MTNQTDRLARRIANLKGYTERVARRPVFGGTQIVNRSTEPAQLIDDFDLLIGQRVGSAEIDDDLGVGWHIEADGTATFHDVLVRGSVTAVPGADKLLNGNFHSDIAHWTAGTGSITLETDPAQIDDGVGALKHTTPASVSETYVSGDNVAIERDVPMRLTARVKPAASGDRHRVSFRWKDSAGTFISESFGPSLTGVTAYTNIEAFAETPFAGTVTHGSSTFGPGSDFQTNVWLFGTYTSIDETGLDTADWMSTNTANQTALWKGAATIGSGSLTGKTPLSLQMTIWSARGFANAYIQPALQIGSTNYSSDYYTVTASDGDVQSNTTTWATNPATGNAWTVAESEAFRVSGGNYIGFQAIANNSYAIFIYKIDFKVNWTSGGGAAIPTQVEPRLYTTPASGAGCITRWDVVELRPQPVTTGGVLEVDRVNVTRIGCHLRRAANQSIGAFTSANISWDTEDEDTDGFVAVTSTTVTIPTGLGGLYDCTYVTKPQSGTASGCNMGVSISGGAREVVLQDDQPARGLLMFASRALTAGTTLVFDQYNNGAGAVNYQAELWLYRTGV